jgi:hypothetical protein
VYFVIFILSFLHKKRASDEARIFVLIITRSKPPAS